MVVKIMNDNVDIDGLLLDDTPLYIIQTPRENFSTIVKNNYEMPQIGEKRDSSNTFMR